MVSILEGSKTIDIREFGTLNTAVEETKMPLGQSPNMSNVWVDDTPGSLVTAKGYKLAGTAPTTNPIRFLYNYRKDDGTQYVLVSDGATVWVTRDFVTFTSIITGLTASFQLQAVTARGKVWLTNGTDAVRTYDGSTVAVLNGDGTTPNVPKGKYISYYHERIWVYNISGSRSSLRFTALVDSSGAEITPDDADAWPATNQINVGDGDGEFGTGVKVYRGKLHVFKPSSIWRIEGADEYNYFPVKTSAETGPRHQETIQELDGLLHFVSLDGVYTFNGDTTDNISKAISPSRGVGNLSIYDLQQPNANERFWEQDSIADWDAGTVPANIDTTTGSVLLKACDSTDSDFNAGSEKTNISVSSGLSIERSGSSGKATASEFFSVGNNIIGLSFLCDGNISTYARCVNRDYPNGQLGYFFSAAWISKVTVSRYISQGPGPYFTAIDSAIQIFSNGAWTTVATLPGHLGGGSIVSQVFEGLNYASFSSDITPVYCSGIRVVGPSVAFAELAIGELEANNSGYKSTAKFVSKTLDLKSTPSSLGNFTADFDLNSGTASFFTQTSSDGVVWDSETAATNGSAIASTAKRYLRWGVNLTSGLSQTTTPVIRSVMVGSVFVSQVYDTASTIYQWKAFEADYSANGGTVAFYHRTATTTGGLASASWVQITPGSDVYSATSNDCIQFKIELSPSVYNRYPEVSSVTINWIIGTAGETSSDQLIHAVAYNSRYWFSASEKGQTANNVIIVRGEKGSNAPWQLKRDHSVLSMTLFNDRLYGGSSGDDGKIFLLDDGYSLAGSAMDAYFETGDLAGDVLMVQKEYLETVVDYELMGDSAIYNLEVGFSTDRGTTWTTKYVAMAGSGRTSKSLNHIFRGKQLRIRIRTNGVDYPFIVHGLTIFYRETKFR